MLWTSKKRPLVETTALPRKMVIAIRKGVIEANELKILKKSSGSLEPTGGWARNVLKNMDWVKIKGTTGKVEPCAKFLEEEKNFRFKVPSLNLFQSMTFH